MSTPAPRVLVPLSRAWRAGATGVFTLTGGGGEELRVHLQGGRVVQVQGAPELLAAVAPPGALLLGALIEDLGLVVSRGVGFEAALRAAEAALSARLGAAVELPRARSSFADAPAPVGAFPLPTPVPRLVAQGLRQARALPALAAALERQKAHKLVVYDQSASEGLDPAALRVLQRGRAQPTVGELLAEAKAKGPAREEETLRALDLVLQLGLAELVEPPRPKGPTPEERAAELLAQAQALRAVRPLHALGLAEVPAAEINRERVQSAFRARAAAAHPDRYTGEPAVVQEAAAELFAALNEQMARVAEADPLLEELKRLGAEQRGEAYVTEQDREHARVVLRKALQAEKARAWQAALDYTLEARRLDPNSPELLLFEAFYGTILKLRPLDEAIGFIDALKLPNDRYRAEAAFRVGWLLRIAERHDQARARFDRAVELNPAHTEAQREARLARSRADPPRKPR